MKNKQWQAVQLIAALSVLLFALPMTVQAQVPITFGPLVGSEVQQTPLCFDESTGRLGRCAAPSTTGYAGSVLVAQGGTGDYASPIEALAAAGDWCPNPTEFNRCQLRIGPGIFGLGTESLNMVDFIDIQGSGFSTTVIASDVEFDTEGDAAGVINGAQATLSDLGVLNLSDNSDPDFATVVIFSEATGFILDSVSAYTTSTPKGGPVAALVIDRGDAIINDSFFLAQSGSEGFGLRVQESNVQVRNSRIFAQGAVANGSLNIDGEDPSEVTILYSSTNEISVDGASAVLNFHWSSAKGGATVTNGATANCFYSFDEDTLVALNSDCS